MWPFSKFSNVSKSSRYKMITEKGNGFYTWNGKLYHSDIVRACIRPKSKAIGKLIAKHIRECTDGVKINPEAYIRFLLEEPNPYMTGQVMQEKVANQLALNNNAFILIIKDEYGYPCELYPIPCSGVEALHINNELYLKFYFNNGNISTFHYGEIIHLRDDFNDNDIFGENPSQALSSLMETVGTTDQGLRNAIKNSGIIQWLLKYTTVTRPEDLKKNAKEFADSYLSIDSESVGVAAVDAKADVIRVEPKDYVPNAAQVDRTTKRLYSFFNTNEKIVMSTYSEDDWISYYEAVIEPLAMQMSNEYTRKLFSRRERGFGNKITFEASSLTYASMSTKLNLVQYVDRGIMTPNEVRKILNWAPIDGGDVAIRRLDTAPTHSNESVQNKTKSFTNNTEQKTYAVDFDGTLCANLFPKIGTPKKNVIDYVKSLKDSGNKIILWTCRTGTPLDEAVEWCKEQGITFDGVNENLEDIIQKFGNDTRKIVADIYLDDKALNVNDINERR